MNIVIAPDSWKESLSASEVAMCIESGFREIFPDADYHQVPMADGGEGTVEALVRATQGEIISLPVTGPLGTSITAFYGLSGNRQTAFIEMSAASGLMHVAMDKRDPLLTTSWGTGELIRHAAQQGVQAIIIGIGGSATNDGGAGMLQALGIKLLDSTGQAITLGGAGLATLEQIDITGLDSQVAGCQIHVACDVTNPLLGDHGATKVFGPQKGADKQRIEILEQALTHYAAVIARELHIHVADIPGAGAAGGMGAGLLAFLPVTLRSGVEIISEALDLDAKIGQASLVITGEGRLDSQSLSGKVPIGVARIAQRHGVPVIAIAGSLSDNIDALHGQGIEAAFSAISRVSTLDEAFCHASENLQNSARNIAAALAIGKRLSGE